MRIPQNPVIAGIRHVQIAIPVYGNGYRGAEAVAERGTGPACECREFISLSNYKIGGVAIVETSSVFPGQDAVIKRVRDVEDGGRRGCVHRDTERLIELPAFYEVRVSSGYRRKPCVPERTSWIDVELCLRGRRPDG